MKEPRLETLSDFFKITHVFVAKIRIGKKKKGIEVSPCNLLLPRLAFTHLPKRDQASAERNCL